MDRGSSVGIATRYALDGPWIKYRWGEIFRARLHRPWGPPSLIYNEHMVILLGKAALANHPHLAKKKEYKCTSTPRLYLRGRLQGDLYLYLEYKMKLFH